MMDALACCTSWQLWDADKPRSVFVAQRLRTLALCKNVWDSKREASSYCWNGGFYENQRWQLPHRPSTQFPTDAEILLELFFSKQAVRPLDEAHASSGRHLVRLYGCGGGVMGGIDHHQN
jgi:hypothetical protein